LTPDAPAPRVSIPEGPMDSRNPVFNNGKEFKRGGYATFDTRTPTPTELGEMYARPSATAAQMGRMTLDDVVVRTATLFAVLLVTASATYFVVRPGPLVLLGSALVGLVLAMAASFGRPKPALMIAYAAVEGVFVGGISFWYESAWNGIVPQAILGTLAAFTAMLVMYRLGVVRNSPKFTKILMIAGVGYLVFAVLNLVLSAFHVGGWQNVYSMGGPLPILLSAFGVVLASLFLVLDFDFIEQGIRNGLPRAYSWTAAFGLVVTLVWLYLEILRLIAILRGND
jgi:uncharacterized YccA/Bax inhibitor family protein